MRIVVAGASGRLGGALVDICRQSGDAVVGLDRSALDLAHIDSARHLADQDFDVLINAAAWTDVDGAARNPERAILVNGVGAGRLAELAERRGALMVQVSSNEVFDGTAGRPYEEGDAPNPINPYGASKLAGEIAVAAASSRHLIVRTAWLFGPSRPSFVSKIVDAGREAVRHGRRLRLVIDEWGNPTWTPALAAAIRAAIDLVTSGSSADRIVHLAGQPPVTRAAWAEIALEAAGIDPEIERVGLHDYERASTPPQRAVLRPTHGIRSIGWEADTRELARGLVVASG